MKYIGTKEYRKKGSQSGSCHPKSQTGATLGQHSILWPSSAFLSGGSPFLSGFYFSLWPLGACTQWTRHLAVFILMIFKLYNIYAGAQRGQDTDQKCRHS